MNPDETASVIFVGKSSQKKVNLPPRLAKRLKQGKQVTQEELEQKLRMADERRQVITTKPLLVYTVYMQCINYHSEQKAMLY